MKRILAVAICVCTLGFSAQAAPIIELAAPRTPANDVYFFDAPQKTQVKKNTKKVTKKTKKKSRSNAKRKVKRTIKKKVVAATPKIPPFNYNNVYKMLEYGYYQGADNVLKQEIAKNPKNDKAIALGVISLAKQNKLDEAQNKLDKLLKTYPNNSDLHYAQGLVNYQRTNSSNMLYRNNTDVLLENAYNNFLKSIELAKNNAKSLNAAGVIDLTNGNIVSAKKYFTLACDADEFYANAIDNLGTIDLIEGKNDEAEKKFKKALNLNKNNPLTYYHLAQLATINKDYQLTLKYLNDALALSPKAPYLLNLLGKTYYNQGNEAAAIDAYKKSIAAKPEFITSYIDLAQIYQKRGDAEFAVSQLKTALNIQPDAYDVKLKIADISYANAKYNQAIDYYKSLVGISIYNEDGLKGLANSYFAKAQNHSAKSLIGSNSEIYKALDCVDKAIQANGNDLELYLAKLKLTRLTNQPEKSRMILDNIVKSDGKNLVDLVVKGEAYLTLYDYKKANELFCLAIKNSKSLKDDLYLAEIFMYHKQFVPAEKILDKIITNNPGNQEALNNLDYIAKCKKYSENYNKSAQAFLKSRNKASAIEYFQRSLAINPNNPDAHLKLAKLYEKQKEYNGALNNYRAYIGLTPENKKNSRKIKNVIKKIRKIENKLL